MKNKYEVDGSIAKIYLTYKNQEMIVMIDSKDLDIVNSFPNKWHVNPSRNKKTFWAVGKITENGKRVIHPMHRWILNPSKTKVIDHLNHNGLDNRRENLRIVTVGENNQNTNISDPRSLTGLAGVSFYKRKNVYIAQIGIDGKTKNLGYFKCKLEAHVAYLNARKELYGL